MVKVFVLGENLGGEFVNNIETVGSRYFAKEEIPDNLAEEKVNRQQILSVLKQMKLLTGQQSLINGII